MTRSIRKTPIAGQTDVSEKLFKRQSRRSARAAQRTDFASILAAHGIDDFDFVPSTKSHGDPKGGPKRGKQYLGAVRILPAHAGHRLVTKTTGADGAMARMRK